MRSRGGRLKLFLRKGESPTCTRKTGTVYQLQWYRKEVPASSHGGVLGSRTRAPLGLKAQINGGMYWYTQDLMKTWSSTVSQDWCRCATSAQKKMTLNMPREFQGHLGMSVSGQPEPWLEPVISAKGASTKFRVVNLNTFSYWKFVIACLNFSIQDDDKMAQIKHLNAISTPTLTCISSIVYFWQKLQTLTW